MRLWLSFLVFGVLTALPLAAQYGRGGGMHSGRFGGFGNPQPIPGSALNGIPGSRPTISLNGLPLSSNHFIHYPCPGCSPFRERRFEHGGFGYGGFGYGFIPLFNSYDFASDYWASQAAPPEPPPVDPTAMAINDQLGHLQDQVNQLQAQASANMPPAQAPAAAEEKTPAEPATVIVLRDGRKVETTNYAVMDRTLWNFSARPVQKIPLSAIDMNASEKANADRGVDFSVPVDSTK
jgi:hypothetical protein